jgi:hypothetical protein
LKLPSKSPENLFECDAAEKIKRPGKNESLIKWDKIDGKR